MTRRAFTAALALPSLTRAEDSGRRPALLIAPEDPFSGLPMLKARYAAGFAPSDDMPGWALSWQLTGDPKFADRALSQMRTTHPPAGGRPSRTWRDYVEWSLAFDWLYTYSGFDQKLRDRIAEELFSAAAAMLGSPDMADPTRVYYHNYSVRFLALAAFPLAALQGHAEFDPRCAPLRRQAAQALGNVLDTASFVTPKGSYHESLDYMRITWAALVLLAELYRTAAGFDPGEQCSVFRNMGATYLYKLLPDGTPSRENDQEFPLLDSRDTAVLGYAVHRFKDPYSAWLLRKSGFVVQQWVVPVLEFLWNDPQAEPRDPSSATETELPHQRFFPGVGHLVMRDGWRPDSTWIEFDCGGYFAKHQHLHQNHFTIYHKGYLAIDSGADYTDIESPHYLNYYRRSVAHNTMLVYEPGEKFFWGDDVLPAANDGGQRMDSVRYWNTIRNPEDWNRTRELWDIGSMCAVHYELGQYHYAMGDASKAYSRSKLRRFTRELVYVPDAHALFVFDRVISTNQAFRKMWLLHGVNEPSLLPSGRTFRFQEGSGELLAHCLLPREAEITKRGGHGQEFFTPGDDRGGAWGGGENWPLGPSEGGPLPDDPKLRHMWKVFYGENFSQLLKSNRKNVVPGAWRVEVSPSQEAEEDTFLNILEIAARGATGSRRIALLECVNFTGAAVENGPAVLFSSAGAVVLEGEATLPEFGSDVLLLSSLRPNAHYQLTFLDSNAMQSKSVRQANGKGILCVETRAHSHGRVRIALAG
ncbi:MAG: heparinase II/III family protein [Acidobacteriaceae bacterium]|nr:heparinase II/III family protein [Acidobacteriaceae bacterium]